jgi:hypothetical protein
MHPKTEEFIDLLTQVGDSPERISSSTAFFISSFINEENVEEMLNLLNKASGGGKERFFEDLASAPTTEEGWANRIAVGAGISEQGLIEIKERWRRCVELIRSRSTL